MRLIDADKLIENMKGMNMLFSPKIVIDNMPTAYDIYKIVEELEIERFRSNYEQEQFVYDKAIEIVKAGGKNDY